MKKRRKINTPNGHPIAYVALGIAISVMWLVPTEILITQMHSFGDRMDIIDTVINRLIVSVKGITTLVLMIAALLYHKIKEGK